jgi:hypothetical protein
MSEIDIIWWFKNLMLPQLRKLCETQANGTEWKTLDALIQYALAQESKDSRIAANRSARGTNLAAVHPAMKKQGSWKAGQKRPPAHRTKDTNKGPVGQCFHCKKDFGSRDAVMQHVKGCPVKRQKMEAQLAEMKKH